MTYALFVTLDVHPDKPTEFIEAITVNAAASLRDEPGCLAFDVHQDIEAHPTTHVGKRPPRFASSMAAIRTPLPALSGSAHMADKREQARTFQSWPVPLLVELPGIEPGSYGIPSRLLRAQFTRPLLGSPGLANTPR